MATADKPADTNSSLSILVSCETVDQALLLYKNPEISGMYLYYDAMSLCMSKGLQYQKDLYLTLPYITRGSAPEGFSKPAANGLRME